MLEKIREGSQGTWAIVILGLVILSFVFAGVGSYITSSGGNAVAEVNGEEIAKTTLDRAYENERARMESQYGEAFSALTADAQYLNQFRQGILDRLIGDKLIEQIAKDLGLRVSDQQIRQQIAQMQEFHIGGKFNNERFQSVLRQVGFQPNAFRDYLRNEMTRQQVAQALLTTEFALQNEAQTVLNLQDQKRQLRYFSVPATPFAADVVVSEDEIQEYYQKNLAQFDTKEKVSIAYVELSADDLMANIDVSEQEIRERYTQSADEYRSEEQRRVSHILIDFAEDEDAAKQQAQLLLERIKKGEDFATLAKAESSDTFSAENGGDLDFFGRDVMDPAFEDAAYALQNVGDVSQVVESEFGYHIIKLTDIKEAQTIAFAEVKQQIADALKKDKAIEEFYVIQQHMAELAFEVVDGLQEVADAANKQIQTTALFDRDNAPEALSHPGVIAAAFSDELINDKVNSDVIEVAENHIVILRVSEHEAERTKALQEVQPQIVALLSADKAQAAAKLWAQETLTAMQNGEDVSDRLSQYELQWQEQSDVQRFGTALPRAVVEKAFQLAPDNADVVELASGGAAVVEVQAVSQPSEAPAEQVTALQQRLASAKSQSSLVALVEALKADADITIYPL